MLPFPSASVRFLGTGCAFPSCQTPWGSLSDSIATEPLFEHLTPEMTAARRAPVLEHLLDAIGVRSRAWARWPGTSPHPQEEDSVSLAVKAARAALADAQLEPIDVGALVLATSTPPRWTAATSSLVAGQLGMKTPFFDVRSGCAGGLYALSLGSILAHSASRPVLVLGSDTFSKTLPAGERFAILAMGDGAGAAVLGPASGDAGLRACAFGGDGAHHDLATVPGTMPPSTLDPLAWSLGGNPEAFSEIIETVLGQALAWAYSQSAERPSLQLIHAGRRAVCERVGLTLDSEAPRWTRTLQEHGNLGAGAVLIAMHEARRAGVLRSGTLMAIASAGGGPSWGGALWREP